MSIILAWHSDTANKHHEKVKKKPKKNNNKKGRKITFEKFRALQSETVATATLYQ